MLLLPPQTSEKHVHVHVQDSQFFSFAGDFAAAAANVGLGLGFICRGSGRDPFKQKRSSGLEAEQYAYVALLTRGSSPKEQLQNTS